MGSGRPIRRGRGAGSGKGWRRRTQERRGKSEKGKVSGGPREGDRVREPQGRGRRGKSRGGERGREEPPLIKRQRKREELLQHCGRFDICSAVLVWSLKC